MNKNKNTQYLIFGLVAAFIVVGAAVFLGTTETQKGALFSARNLRNAGRGAAVAPAKPAVAVEQFKAIPVGQGQPGGPVSYIPEEAPKKDDGRVKQLRKLAEVDLNDIIKLQTIADLINDKSKADLSPFIASGSASSERLTPYITTGIEMSASIATMDQRVRVVRDLAQKKYQDMAQENTYELAIVSRGKIDDFKTEAFKYMAELQSAAAKLTDAITQATNISQLGDLVYLGPLSISESHDVNADGTQGDGIVYFNFIVLNKGKSWVLESTARVTVYKFGEDFVSPSTTRHAALAAGATQNISISPIVPGLESISPDITALNISSIDDISRIEITLDINGEIDELSENNNTVVVNATDFRR